MSPIRTFNTPFRLAAKALFAWVALAGSLAIACTIPVFRYALERWESDRLLLVVYHDQLTQEQNAAISALAEQSTANGGPLNIEVIRYDLASASPLKLLDLEPQAAERPLPWVEVRSRVAERRTVPLWQGTLAEVTSEARFFDSPARREIVRRLLAGDSSVFLLIAPDDQLHERSEELQKRLNEAASSLALPMGIGLPGSELHSQIPLQIRFSVLPIAHANPAEQPFFKLLAASAREWNTDTAYVVPVFGRCRALEVIPYAETDETLIQDVSGFLCGACSCRVKQANPGFDLLVSVVWEQQLFGNSIPAAILATNPSDAASSTTATEYLAIPTGTQPAVEAKATERIQTPSQKETAIRVLGLLAVIAVCGAAVILVQRYRH